MCVLGDLSIIKGKGVVNPRLQFLQGACNFEYLMHLYDIFQKRSAFPGSQYPFISADTGANRSYSPGDCPIAEAAFQQWITMDLHEHYTDLDIEEIAFGIAKVAHHLGDRKLVAMTPAGTAR